MFLRPILMSYFLFGCYPQIYSNFVRRHFKSILKSIAGFRDLDMMSVFIPTDQMKITDRRPTNKLLRA